MEIFYQHVGLRWQKDIDRTISRNRSVTELLTGLPSNAPERPYFETDQALQNAFPNGNFNCWGVPSGAKPSFDRTHIGDLVLFLPKGGPYGSPLEHIGIVKAICPVECWEASKLLWHWPDPISRFFPYLFFFDTESGYRSWDQFTSDLGMGPKWNPRGMYKRFLPSHFKNGAEGYLKLLRQEGFH